MVCSLKREVHHSNLRLYNTEAALEWVRDYIPRFGGNAVDITLFGESVGGGVIMHLITAYGGLRDPPAFQKVSSFKFLRISFIS